MKMVLYNYIDGLLPKTLGIEDIKIGRSEIKNKVIARFFKEIKFIEEWGTGIILERI